MSISIHSETSKDEIETEDAELEDLVWNFMSQTGILSQVQGQISKFIEDNGKTDNVTFNPERTDGKILGYIFEYLQWVGMKQTNSVLLSESPVEVDVSIYESREEGPDYKPEIYKLFEDHNATEDRGSATHNYSRDEFEDSRLTSASGHQSVKSDNGNDVEDEASDDGNSNSSLKHSKNISIPEERKNSQTPKSLEKVNTEPEEILPISNKLESNKLNMEDRNNDNDMISFFSPAPATKGLDRVRPHVTVRPRFDNNASSDPFDSPRGTGISLDALPVVDSNNRLNFVQASSSSNYEILSEENERVGEENEASHHTTSSKDLSADQKRIQGQANVLQSSSHPSQKNTSKPVSHVSQNEEDSNSTSDFMETLSIEEDTQDASIASDSKGMSSCEHAVNLK